MSIMEECEPTVWEDINPTTALARQPERDLTSSERLRPASTEQFRNELVACLALVAPVGMTEEARRDWLKVAWATVGHLPSTLLSIGCQKARETADHPSKIVPIILAETSEAMERRREEARRSAPEPLCQLPEPDACTPEQAAEILAEFGLKSNPLDS